MTEKTTIVIATESAAKIKGLQRGFVTALGGTSDLDFCPCDAKSGVPDQPRGHTETMQGALNRIADAKAAIPHADYYVANESGVDDQNGRMHIINYVVVEHREQTSINTTTSFEVPPRVAVRVRAGAELGPAFEAEFGHLAHKSGIGGIGFMTDEHVTRADLLAQATITCLIPFLKPDLFSETPDSQKTDNQKTTAAGISPAAAPPAPGH